MLHHFKIYLFSLLLLLIITYFDLVPPAPGGALGGKRSPPITVSSYDISVVQFFDILRVEVRHESSSPDLC